jgi:hypothetical protein
MRKQDNNIKTDLKLIGCEAVDWIRLVQDGTLWWALVKTAVNIHVP